MIVELEDATNIFYIQMKHREKLTENIKEH